MPRSWLQTRERVSGDVDRADLMLDALAILKLRRLEQNALRHRRRRTDEPVRRCCRVVDEDRDRRGTTSLLRCWNWRGQRVAGSSRDPEREERRHGQEGAARWPGHDAARAAFSLARSWPQAASISRPRE